MVSLNLLRLPQPPQREVAGDNPNKSEGRKYELVIDQEINPEGHAKNEQESPIPTSARRLLHRRLILATSATSWSTMRFRRCTQGKCRTWTDPTRHMRRRTVGV